MKKVISLLCVAVMLFSMVGCSAVKKAEEAVVFGFEAVKNFNFEGMKQYFNITYSNEEFDFWEMEDETDLHTPYKMVFEKIKYEIIETEKVSGDLVIVKTKIAAPDMAPIMENYLKQVMALSLPYAFAGEEAPEDEINALTEKVLKEELSKEDLVMKTSEAEIKVSKTSEGWKITADKEVLNAMFGGLIDIAENLKSEEDK